MSRHDCNRLATALRQHLNAIATACDEASRQLAALNDQRQRIEKLLDEEVASYHDASDKIGETSGSTSPVISEENRIA